MNTPANLRPDAFKGTAAAYLRWRPRYPCALLDDLLRHTAVAGGTLLDLACGPGRVVLDLAGSFATVRAIDLEPEMIEVAKRESARRGIGHVHWLVGRAEDLDLAPGSVDLVTIGEAFHRLDQALVARKVLGWLRPGGCLATLGTEGILDGPQHWQTIVAGIARTWTSRAFPSGWAPARAGIDTGPAANELALRTAGFVDVETRSFRQPHDWSFEAIVGYLESTSVCSKRALGGGFARFVEDLDVALAAESPDCVFHEELRCGYTVGRKPA